MPPPVPRSFVDNVVEDVIAQITTAMYTPDPTSGAMPAIIGSKDLRNIRFELTKYVSGRSHTLADKYQKMAPYKALNVIFTIKKRRFNPPEADRDFI